MDRSRMSLPSIVRYAPERMDKNDRALSSRTSVPRDKTTTDRKRYTYSVYFRKIVMTLNKIPDKVPFPRLVYSFLRRLIFTDDT